MIYSNSDYGKPKKKKSKGIFVTLIFILFFIVGGFGYYKFVYSRNVFLMFLENAFKYLENSFVDDYDSLSASFDINFDFVSGDNEDKEALDIFNKLDFSVDYGIDYDKNIMNVELSSLYDDKTLLDGSLYTEYGRMYIYLDNLYDKYIEVSLDEYSKLFEKRNDDYKVVFSSLSKHIISNLKDEYFSVEKVTLEGKKVTKTVLDLSEDNYSEYQNNMIKSLINDKKFLESYASISGEDIEDIKKNIKGSIDDESNGVKYILYSDRFKFLKLRIDDGEASFIVEKNQKEFEYSYYEIDEIVFNGNVEIIGDENDNTVVFSYYSKEDNLGMELTVDSKLEKNALVERIDVSNSISSEKISEQDVISIYSKLLKNEGIVKIVEEISNLSSQNNNTLDIVNS